MPRIVSHLLCTLLILPLMPRALQAEEPSIIAEHMAMLKPFAGSWKARIKLHQRDGTVTESVGEYEIAPVLAGTYLEWNTSMKEEGRDWHPLFILMTTYDSRQKAYVQTYFYPQTALQVTESGEFDAATSEYHTTGLIEGASDGRDYSVRSTTKLNEDGSIDFWNWGRYENEKTEMLDMEARLTRVK